MDIARNKMRACEMAKRVLLILAAVIAAFVLAIGIDHWLHSQFGATSYGTVSNEYWTAFFFGCIILLECAFFLRKVTAKKPEYLFLAIVLTTTVVFSWTLGTWQYSWDDGVHYRNTAILHPGDERIQLSVAEDSVIAFIDPLTNSNVNNIKDHSLDATKVREFVLNSTADEAGSAMKPRPIKLTEIEYFPGVLMKMLCDFLGLSFSLTFFLTKLPGALIYSFVTFFGMRKLSSGQMVYAIAALIPTNIFLAANYSYSYWTFSFLLFGFASFVGMMQRKRPPKVLNLVLMLGALFLGCLPRIAYFPLILICLGLPRRKFKNTRDCWIYRCAVFAVCVATASLYFWPLSVTGLGDGDTRGTTVIDPTAQLAFILEHPIGYAKTVLGLLLPPFQIEDGLPDAEGPYYVISGLLSPAGMQGTFTNYGYLPRPPLGYSIAILILLVFTFLTDGGPKKGRAVPIILTLITCSITLILIVTFMYLIFTGVESDIIRGVQRRYLLPFLYPLVAFLGVPNWRLPDKRIPAEIYNTVILMAMAVILMGSWWQSYLCALN